MEPHILFADDNSDICELVQADKEAGVLAGAQGYLGKPFNSAELIGALRTVLKTSAADSAFANG